MKKIIYLGVAMSMIFISCDKKASIDSYDWEGVYTMETTIGCINADGTRVMNIYGEDGGKTLSSEINFYKESNNLYVQTQHFGTPDTTLQHFYPIKLPRRIINDETDSLTTLKPIIDFNPQATILIMNGIVYVRKNGQIYSSTFPAQVKSITPNELAFYPSQNFTIPLIASKFGDYTEDYIYAILNCQYLYGDIKKNGNKITWDITLQIDYPKDYTIADIELSSITYHNIVVKK